MDRQAVFNKVYAAVTAQGGPSINANGCCSYRGENGRKCALGHLIPDALYTTDMEGNGARALMREFPALARELGYEQQHAAKCDGNFLQALQWAHDTAADAADADPDTTFLDAYTGHMEGYASDYGLTVPQR